MYKLTPFSSIIRLEDGASIPNDPHNTDYAEYLVWVSQGNTVTPADLPNPKLAVQAQIADLESKITPRRIREAMVSGDYSIIKGIDNQIFILRSTLQNLSPVL